LVVIVSSPALPCRKPVEVARGAAEVTVIRSFPSPPTIWSVALVAVTLSLPAPPSMATLSP
jgi:hypothetical protein